MYKKLESLVDIGPFDMTYLNTVCSSNICLDERNREAFGAGMQTAIVLRSRKVKNCCIDGLVRLLSFSSGLELFQLSETEISVHSSSLVADCLSGLMDIHLLEINFENFTNLVDLQLRKICKQHRHLVKLNLFGCEKLTDVGLLSVSEFCLRLEWLNLGKLANLTDKFINDFSENCCEISSVFIGHCHTLFSEGALHALVSKKAKTLVEIDISGILRHGLVVQIGMECHNLTVLNLTGSVVVLDPAIESICVGCTNLTSLNVSNLVSLKIGHFLHLLGSLHFLAHFTFAGVNSKLCGDIYYLLSQKFHSFSHLDTVGDYVAGKPIVPCPALKIVLDSALASVKQKTTSSYHTEWYKNVGKCVGVIADKCRGTLRSLKINGDLTSEIIFSLFPLKHELNFLFNLSLVRLKCLSDAKLDDLSYLCANLSVLNIESCPFVSSVGIISICSNCASVEHLSLCGFVEKSVHGIICDKALSDGISCLHNLRSLRLSFLYTITVSGLKKVASDCKKLHNNVEIVDCGVDQALINNLFV
jgi:hypothetical protein